MGWLFYTDRRVQSYADEKAEITRLCTFETDARRTTLVKASKVGSTWYAAAKVESLDPAPLEDRTYVTDEDGSFIFGAVFLTRYDDRCSVSDAVRRPVLGLQGYGGKRWPKRIPRAAEHP